MRVKKEKEPTYDSFFERNKHTMKGIISATTCIYILLNNERKNKKETKFSLFKKNYALFP